MAYICVVFCSFLSNSHYFICCCSVAKSCSTLWDPMDCGMLVLHYLLESVQTNVHWVVNAIQLSHPLSPPSPPALNLSQHQGFFQWISSSHQVAKYWSFSFYISPSNEYSGLISCRIDCFNLLAVKETLKKQRHHFADKGLYSQNYGFSSSHYFIRTSQSVK